MKSDAMRNLSGSILSEATGAEGRTIRAWIGINGLVLGDRATRAGGHPRYDLSDIAKVLMVDQLIERFGMKATVAVHLTNEASGQLVLLAEDEIAEIDGGSRSADHFILCFQRAGAPVAYEIITPDEFEPLFGTMIMQGIVDLRALVKSARDLLAGVVSI